MTTSRSEFFAGIKDTLPIIMGVLPFGLIYGVSARSMGLSLSLAQAMSSIVFAGSAQFVTVQLIGASLPAGIILLTACIINLRHALYSASIAPYLQRVSIGWKLILAYVLTDEVYAIVITRYQQRGENAHKHWYFLGAGLTLWSIWQVSTAIGLLLGTNIPASWSLDFALPLTFIALVIPTLKQRVDGIVAATAGLVVVLTAHLPLNTNLLIATFMSILIGLLIETKSRKSARAEEGAAHSDHFTSVHSDFSEEGASKEVKQ